MDISFRTFPINAFEVIFDFFIIVYFVLVCKRIFQNRKTGMYFIRRLENVIRIGFEDGSNSHATMLKKYKAEDITYISPLKTMFFFWLFLLPVLLIVATFIFQLNIH